MHDRCIILQEVARRSIWHSNCKIAAFARNPSRGDWTAFAPLDSTGECLKKEFPGVRRQHRFSYVFLSVSFLISRTAMLFLLPVFQQHAMTHTKIHDFTVLLLQYLTNKASIFLSSALVCRERNLFYQTALLIKVDEKHCSKWWNLGGNVDILSPDTQETKSNILMGQTLRASSPSMNFVQATAF